MKTPPQKDGSRHNYQATIRKEQGTTQTMDVDKAKGVIYALAVGDALGYPTEFMTLDRIKREYGQEGIRNLPETALYSDDTQMRPLLSLRHF